LTTILCGQLKKMGCVLGPDQRETTVCFRQENVKGDRPRAAHDALRKQRAARSMRSDARPLLRCYLGCMVGLTAGIPRQGRKISAAGQLFTLIVAGLASRNVSGVSGRSLMSRFAVTSATVVPAAAPTGPPIAAPIPPPAKAPIKTPPPAPPPIHSRWCFMWPWPEEAS